MSSQDQNRKKRSHDELATAHASMLRVLQSKSLPANTRAKKIVTTIQAKDQVYRLESYRDDKDQIGHSITTALEDVSKTQPSGPAIARAGA